MTPTDQWLGALPKLPALAGAAGVAERLLLLLHYGIDWDSWVGGHRASYWSSLLPDRVYKATYRSPTLGAWWSQLSTDLVSAARIRDQQRTVLQRFEHRTGLRLFPGHASNPHGTKAYPASG